MRVRAQSEGLRESGTTGTPRCPKRRIDSPSRTLKTCVNPTPGPPQPSLASVSVPSMSMTKRAMSAKGLLMKGVAIVIICARW